MAIKKSVFLIAIFLCVLPLFCKSGNEYGGLGEDQFITKTYRLQYVTSEQVARILGRYIIEASSPTVVNVITVKILKKDEKEFENLLKQIDIKENREKGGLFNQILSIPRRILGIEKRSEIRVRPTEDYKVFLRIFTVIASREERATRIDDADLKRVLSELSNLLNFKSYHLDGTSAIVVKNLSSGNYLKLASSIPDLGVRIDDVSMHIGEEGRRVIELGQFELHDSHSMLLSTNTSLNEGGYLVVGITELGNEGDSLVLVLNARVQ